MTMGLIIDRRSAGLTVPSGSSDGHSNGRAEACVHVRSAAHEPQPFSVRQSDVCLLLDAALPCDLPQDPARRLALNAELPAPAKVCLGPNGDPRLRGELPLLPEAEEGACEDIESLAAAGLVCMSRAVQILRREAHAHEEAAPAAVDVPDVISLCAAGAWPCVEREAGLWMVQLEGTSSYCQAEVTAQGAELRLAVPLAPWPSDAVTQDAVCRFLLTASGTFRIVAASLTEADQQTRTLLSTRVPFARAATLPVALAALSVAARHTLRETRALANPIVASQFLARCASHLGSAGSRRIA